MPALRPIPFARKHRLTRKFRAIATSNLIRRTTQFNQLIEKSSDLLSTNRECRQLANQFL